MNFCCPENPMDIRAGQDTVHGVTKELDITEWLNNNNEIFDSVSMTSVSCWDPD